MIKSSFSLIAFVLIVTSCTTYLIPVSSFKEQFAGIDSTKLLDVRVKGPGFTQFEYKANPITTINCVDKENKPAQLKNSPSIEMRVTYGKKNKRAIFYFDRVYVSQRSLVGVQSRFISSIRKTIPLDSITKIEVQDGQKKFSYVDR
jgi:single-stranded DNA-specific DHH superfamily exonuclease